jgi:cystathionine beta-synthase
MHSPALVATDASATVRSALELIRTNDVSQLPVFEGEEPVGAVHDADVMTAVMERPAVLDQPIHTIMGPGFPLVPIGTPIEDLMHIMTARKNSAVLVEEEGRVLGILTRYDVVEYLGR